MRRSLAVVVSASLVLLACGDDDDDEEGGAETTVTVVDQVAAAEARLAAAQDAAADAEGELEASRETFCGDAEEYIEAIDRYGRVLDRESAATVGDVRTAGADLAEPRTTAATSAEAVVAARDALAAAEAEVLDAEVALVEAQSGEPSPTTAPAPTTTTLVPPATVERVEQAEADLAATSEGITDQTTLVEAGEQFNAAALSLEIAWLRLLDDGGCLSDDQRSQAVNAVSQYTVGIQTDLQVIELYTGPIDGIYGPETVAAVEQLQTDSGLPVTGYVDRATSAALDAAVTAVGNEVARAAMTYTTAVQTTLALLGYWDAPIDGVWSEELTTAVNTLQTDLGVPVTGAIDAATLAAITQRIAELEGSTETTTTTAAAEETTTTAAEETTTTVA